MQQALFDQCNPPTPISNEPTALCPCCAIAEDSREDGKAELIGRASGVGRKI